VLQLEAGGQVLGVRDAPLGALVSEGLGLVTFGAASLLTEGLQSADELLGLQIGQLAGEPGRPLPVGTPHQPPILDGTASLGGESGRLIAG
jgi:hypothetical protein